MSITLMRKYSKPLMAFFGVILMIVFLAGYSYTSGMGKGGSSFVIGKLDGQPLTTGDLTIATIDVRILRRLNPGLVPWLSQRNNTDAAIQFYLLLREARQNGFLPDYNTAAAELSDKRVQKRVEAVMQNSSYVAQNIVQAIGDYNQIQALANFVYGAAQPSDPQLAHTISELESSLQIGYIRLRAADNAGAMPSPGAALLQTLFSRYRTMLPWDPSSPAAPPTVAGHQYPFGYRYPDRVKIEFMKFQSAKVRAGMKVTFADVQAAYRYYQNHRDEFAVEPPASADSTSAPTVYKPFAAVKAKLIRQQQDKRIELLFRRMTEYATRQTGKVWANPEIDGLYAAMPAAKWASYKGIAAKIGKRFGYTPLVATWNQWADASALSSLRGIGQAGVTESGFSAPVGLATLAMKVHELDLHSKGLGLLLHLQVGRDGPVLTDSKGNDYIYRVTAVSPAHDPKTLKQVQAQVVHDARLLEAYKADTARGAVLAALAVKIGLAAVAKKETLPVQFPNAFTALTRYPVGYDASGEAINILVPSYVPGVHGRLGQLTRASIRLARQEQAMKVAKSTRPETAAQLLKTEKLSALIARLAGKPATCIAVDPRLEVFVLQLVHARPLPANVLAASYVRVGGASVLNFQMRQLYLGNWLRYKSVVARSGFVPVQ